MRAGARRQPATNSDRDISDEQFVATRTPCNVKTDTVRRVWRVENLKLLSWISAESQNPRADRYSTLNTNLTVSQLPSVILKLSCLKQRMV